MNIKVNSFLCLWIFLYSINLSGQVQFSDQTRLYKKNIPTKSINPGAMLDIDGDLIDDLVIIDKGKLLKIVKSSGTHFSLILIDSFKITNGFKWSITAGDLNNDGNPEFISSGEYDLVNINSLTNQKINNKTLFANVYAQASNTVDINNDGWLDYFVCNDDGHPKVFLNDKNGSLFQSAIINFTINDNTDGSGNYGSEWVDVNGDMLPDLCISKCRAGVTNPSDLRRINRLYINQGNGSFIDQAKKFGLDSGEQTWVTTFGDIDNDGDLDAFVVNHYAPHMLLENIGNQNFEEIKFPTPLSSFGLQAVMRDFDNDGFLDIMITGVEGATYLHNNGNKTFTIVKNIFGNNLARSMTIGDLNDDGFLDVYTHLTEPINVVGVKDDMVWLNNGNDNHFVKFNLEGSKSNASAIGSRIEIFTTKGRQIRYVKGGESYGIFNSLQQHFGIADQTKIDSVKVFWPSGTTDIYTNLVADKTYLVQEGKCISPTVNVHDDIQIIATQNRVLKAPIGMSKYTWNTGSSTQEITISKEGTYHVKMTDSLGCKIISKPIIVKSGCFKTDAKLITESDTVKACLGKSLTIASITAYDYLWSGGSTEQTLTVNTSGLYELTANDYCGKILKDKVYVQFLNSDLITQNDTIFKGQRATLKSNDAQTMWFNINNTTEVIYQGKDFITGNLDTTKTYLASVQKVINQKMSKVGHTNFPNDNFYGSNNTDSGLAFSVSSPCVLSSVLVNTDTTGTRKILIKNNLDQIIFQKDIFIKAGISRLILDARLPVGQFYKISTDAVTNMISFGHKGPRLVRTINNTMYPYVVEDVVSIQSSLSGAIYYYYFYDWEVHYDIVTCESGLKEVVAFVKDTTSSTFDKENSTFRIFPNPTKDWINISQDGQNIIKSMNIHDLQGRMVLRNIKESPIDISSLPDGLYILNIRTNHKSYYFKVLKK